MTDTLYDEDFVTWTERQAAALRAAAREGSNLPIDWENLAEEIEDVGKDALRSIQSLTELVILHCLKLACSPAVEPRRKWFEDVDLFRDQLGDRLAQNHAIRARYDRVVEGEFSRATRKAERTFRRYGEESALPLLARWRERGITAAEVLEDGLYPEPGTLRFRKEPD